MEILIAEITGLAASVFIFAISLPQLVKIIKSRSVQGVSATTWSLTLMTYAVWFGYSPRLEAVAVGVNNLLAGVITGVLLGYIFYVKTGSKVKATIFSSVIFLLGASIGYYIPELIVQILLFASAFMRAPQAIESYKNWKHKKSTQVSLTTWVISTAGSAFWVFYGVMIQDALLIIVPGISLLLAAAITLFEYLNFRSKNNKIIN